MPKQFKNFQKIILIAFTSLFLLLFLTGCKSYSGVTNLKDGYDKRNNQVFYNGVKIQDVDAASLKIINTNLAVDKNNVFFKGRKTTLMDATTFHNLNSCYSKDKNGIYRVRYDLSLGIDTGGPWLESVKEADMATFSIINDDFAKDKNHIYGCAGTTTYDPATVKILSRDLYSDKSGIRGRMFNEIIGGLDLKTFQVLNDDFSKDKNGVYWFLHSQKASDDRVKKADPNTFKALEDNFGLDKNNIYYGPDIMAQNNGTFEYLQDFYAKNNENIYYMNRVISNDLAGFKLLESGYAKDSKNLYYQGHIIGEKTTQAQLEQFKVIQKYLATDGKDIYNEGRLIKGADPKTFEVISSDDTYPWPYIKDQNAVYFGENKIDQADPQSFEVIYFTLARDNKHVFLEDKIIKDADPNSIEVLPSSGLLFLKDKNHIFSQAINGDATSFADATTFQSLDYNFFKDKNYVYFYDGSQLHKITNVDPKTFEPLSYLTFKDKNDSYTFIDFGSDIKDMEAVSQKEADKLSQSH